MLYKIEMRNKHNSCIENKYIDPKKKTVKSKFNREIYAYNHTHKTRINFGAQTFVSRFVFPRRRRLFPFMAGIRF